MRYDLTNFINPKIREFYKNSYKITKIEGFHFGTCNGIKKYFLRAFIEDTYIYDIGQAHIRKQHVQFLYMDPINSFEYMSEKEFLKYIKMKAFI